jgi:hypothetical protein
MEKNLNLKQIQEFFSKPLEENTFKVGDKITYLGHPGEITATKEYNGRNFVSVSYDKGKGKTKASDILTTDGTVKAVAEGFKDYLGYSSVEVSRPTQDQVDRFFALTQNETHYLNSKPVAGQEKTFNKMEVEPWDEYDLSNWNSLVRKAKQRGKSIDEASRARVSMPRFKKDKNNPNFLNVYIDYDLGPGGSSIALGKETMTGQIRRESAAEAMRLASDIARDLEAKYNLEDIDIQDLENGKVQIFAVSDDFIDMDPNMLGESLNENLNPEVSNAVNRFIKAMAKRYDYSEQDAVYAIMAALKQRKFDGLNESQEEDKIDIVTMDVPLFIRILEYSREDAQEDMDLHDLTEKAIEATKQQGILQMDDYDMLVGSKEPMNKLTVAEKVIAQLKEAKPGLWANINAKQKRGEKPSHGNSDAFKSAKKAGKKINSLKEEEGVPHFTKDGKEWKGKTHKMPDDSLMSGNPHDKNGSGPNGKSEKLFHKEDLNEINEGVDMAELEFTLKRTKKENPGKKIGYAFFKDAPKGYRISINGKYTNELVNEAAKGIVKGDEAIATAYPVVKSFIA